jgi:predicted lipid carrier protein YhbT
VSTDWTYWGMGMFYGVSTADDYGTQIRHLFHFTPVPGDRVLFHIATSVNLATVPAELIDYVQEKSAELTARNLDDDAPIWARKRYLVRPVLCEGDGPYGLLRRWTRQFFPEPRRDESTSQATTPPAEIVDEHAGGLYQIASEQGDPNLPPAALAASGGDVDATPEAVRRVFFERLPAQFNPAAVSGPFVVQYDITGDSGGTYFVEVDSGRCSPAAGEHAAPAVRVSIDAGDWLRLQGGLLDGTTAFLSGRLKVQGDMSLAMKLAEVFPLASRAG